MGSGGRYRAAPGSVNPARSRGKGAIRMAWLAGFGRGIGDLLGLGVDLVCPPRCVFCRQDLEATGSLVAPVCDSCRRLLSSDGARCLRCGAAVAEGVACRACRAGRRPWDGIVVLGGYADELRQAVLAAKRPAGELNAAGLAALLLDRHAATLMEWRPEVVVPVPMHWTRRAVRGTSAAYGLARHLAAGLSLPCRSLIRRTRATRMQNELPHVERPANVQGVFRSRAAGGRRVLLVDDVMTTGATLAACRTALLAAGAAAVHAAVVARADRGHTTDDSA